MEGDLMLDFVAIRKSKYTKMLETLLNYILVSDINTLDFQRTGVRCIDLYYVCWFSENVISYSDLMKAGVVLRYRNMVVDNTAIIEKRGKEIHKEINWNRHKKIVGVAFQSEKNTWTTNLIAKLLNYVVFTDMEGNDFGDFKDYIDYLYSMVGISYFDITELGIK